MTSNLNKNSIPPSPKTSAIDGNNSNLNGKRNRSGTPGGTGRGNFRPVTRETKAQLDAFFGQTSKQQKEGRLRTKDEDGRKWYDGIGELTTTIDFLLA